ncbi:hypothetical protein ACHAWU_010203 [Discostella pseudostelligera]|uniref:YCII-related domain-containing protein n=1 Tax=Discostella pseudostelligera TaxID=259834 RepID=A0ABD3MB03_9STRA
MMMKTLVAHFVSIGYACCFIVQGFCTSNNSSPRPRRLIPVSESSFFASLTSAHHNNHGTISTPRRTRHRKAITLNSAPDGMHWFVKTEQFCKPYLEVKIHLEAHRAWVRSIREQSNDEHSVSIVSGYRVDRNDKPGGGGLMIFAAKDYEAAEQFVRSDPLIINDCVNWQLNKWIAETGDISIE